MSGANYIGSKISLISLSDIRYVGVLQSINAEDSTVGLTKVHFFGTEGRRGKLEEIPANDNVFDYVVFRGSDIKDLQVFEAPPPPPQDPAIMSMSNAYPPMDRNGSGNTYMPSQQPTQQQQQQQQQQQPLQQQQPIQQQHQQQQQQQKYWQTSSLESESLTNAHTARRENETLDELKNKPRETRTLPPTINEAAIEQLVKEVKEISTNEDNSVNHITTKEDQTNQQTRAYSNQNRNGRGGNRYNNNNNRKNELPIPTHAFDFESSNAKFDKSEIVKKDGDNVINEEEQDDSFYDKASSFFDNISCESKERSEKREQNESHRPNDRHLNYETFGQSTVDHSRYRNNYRGRGRGNRGTRGGGSGYYRNNNNHYNNSNNEGYRNGQNKPQQQQGSL